MRKAFINAKLLRDGKITEGAFAIENGAFTNYIKGEDAIDLQGDTVIPGLIDLHTHGRCGFDFDETTPEELIELKKLYAKKGVTTVIPTLASNEYEKMLQRVREASELGFPALHIEGRYMNPEKKGAHAPEYLAPLDPKEIEDFAEAAKNMHLHFSCAFELDKDGKFLDAILSHGYTASLAHTTATYSEAAELVKKGVRSFTHLFNAMPPIHHRAGGAVLAALTSDAYTEVICDGYHLAPETVKLIRTAKSKDRVILITDSILGAGYEGPNRSFFSAGLEIFMKDGTARLSDGTIAGSTLELWQGVKNYMSFTGADLPEAVACATENPANLLGLKNVGKIENEYKANFLRISDDLSIKEVYVEGEKI
ncbi:MAG: N-acetylglucosamine-6-phosphate deacetylase [Ruminococcaceae bacterium]|nr:N-acetylglucosamine-6-phosphate deacetylase [Oscillospiraceae bacterium]